MLRTPTLDKLRDLNLMGMARAFQEQTERPDYQALTFEDRLGLMVDVEMEERENRRLFRYLKSARLRDNACVEDVNFHTPRGLQRAQILELAECRWIGAHQNVLVTGKTGVGKTFIACALAQAAIRHGHTALYLRVPRLIDELAVARVDGRLPRLLAAWARVEVLLLDDFAMQALSNQQGADLLEVIEDRTQRRSTIVTSQLAVKHWHEMLGDPTLADAIMDRLVHHAHRIELDGPSMRDARTTQDGQSDRAGDPQRPAQGSKQAKSTVAGEKRAATTAQDAR